MGLFEPVWMSTKPAKARKAVEMIHGISSQAKLARIARKAPREAVREAAIARLTDDNALFDVAMHEQFLRIKILAARQIGDQATLNRLTRESQDKEVVAAAVERLTDQKVLYRIVLESKDDGIVARAIRRITDQGLLYQIASESRDSGIVAFAMGMITDQAVLRRIVMQGRSQLRAMAAGKITDMELLRKLADDPDAAVRREALDRLNDETRLLEAALNDADEDVRLKAATKLKRKDIVDAINAEREEARRQQEAIRINQRIDRMMMVSKEKDCWDYKAIIDSITDIALLSHIWHKARCYDIASYARARFLALTPPDELLLPPLLAGKSGADDRFVDLLSRDGLLALIERGDTSLYLVSQSVKRAVRRFRDDPETLFHLYRDYEHKLIVRDLAWEELFLSHRAFLADHGLQKEAEEAYARHEADLEAWRRQMDENMDKIPMDY